MLLYNENGGQLSADDIAGLKAELQNLDDVSVPDFDEIQADLETYYLQAEQSEKKQYGLEAIAAPVAIGLGGNIFEKIRRFICAFLAAGSTAGDIIDKILEAISSIIPGGIIIKWIVKKIVKFILDKGYAALCPVG